MNTGVCQPIVHFEVMRAGSFGEGPVLTVVLDAKGGCL